VSCCSLCPLDYSVAVELDYVIDWHKQYSHNYEWGELPSYLTSEQASSKTHFQRVRSSFLHYDLVFYSIEKELNFVRRKASCGLQESFRLHPRHPRPISSVYEVRSCTTKLVFYRIAKTHNFMREKVVLAILGLR
jgi:hypothetical protein